MPVRDAKASTPRAVLEAVFDDKISGILGWFGEPWVIPQLHRHNDIELNLVARGQLHYLFGGQVQAISAGQLAVFWAVAPHRIVYTAPETLLGVIQVPLLEFLRWNLPIVLQEGLLHGKVILGQDAQPHFDQMLFERWAKELQQTPVPSVNPNPLERHRIVLLEVEARLLRHAREIDTEHPLKAKAVPPTAKMDKAQQLARLLAERHSQPIALEDIAAEVGLNPSYAMTLFRTTLGLTMYEYLNQHRIAHAQRLLITSDLPILDVALEAGFGSLSRFYQAFKTSSGYSPKTYRAMHFRG